MTITNAEIERNSTRYWTMRWMHSLLQRVFLLWSWLETDVKDLFCSFFAVFWRCFFGLALEFPGLRFAVCFRATYELSKLRRCLVSDGVYNFDSWISSIDVERPAIRSKRIKNFSMKLDRWRQLHMQGCLPLVKRWRGLLPREKYLPLVHVEYILVLIN